MPLYAYECSACDLQFEKQQPFAADPIKVCPECGTESVRRLISSVGVIFKGSGFYITDSRKSSGDGKEGFESKASSESKKDSSTSESEAKKSKVTSGE